MIRSDSYWLRRPAILADWLVHALFFQDADLLVPAGTLRFCTAPNGRQRVYLSFADLATPKFRRVPDELVGLVELCTTPEQARALLTRVPVATT